MLEAALARNASDGEYVGLLGLCLLDANQVRRATELLETKGAGASEHFRLAIFEGRLLQEQGRHGDAHDAYRRATRLNERAVEAWVGLIDASVRERKLGRALRHAQRLEELNPSVGAPQAARILRMQGDEYRRGEQTIELAADKYVAALERVPDDESLATLVLETQLAAVRLDPVRELVQARYGDEQGFPFHYWTGRLEMAEQHGELARAALSRARELAPEDPRPVLWLAKLALDDGDREGSRALLESCRELGLQTAQTEVLMGEVLSGLGDLEGAEQHLRAAIAKDRNLSKAHYLLGRVLLRQGRRAEAKEVLDHFAEMTKPPPVDIGDDPGDR